MRAVLVDAEKRLVWSEVPDPAPRDGDILLEVRAAGVNRADLMQRAGQYPPPAGWPEWMGLEAAGVVLAAPAGSRWRKGDRVCALLGGGGYAERVAVPADMALPVPGGLSMVEAAAIPEAFATSYLNLCVEAGMKAGDTVLIQAGASGLGMAAIQLAKTLGAAVMTTVGSEEKARFVRGLGADIVVNRKTGDLAAAMDGHPVDIAMDCVGGPNLGRCIGRMAVGGRWILIATRGGNAAELPLDVLYKRGIRLIGSTLRSRSSRMKAEILAGLEAALWPALASGAVRPVIHRTVPMARAEEAHAVLLNNENSGKVVLTPEP